MVPTDDPPPLNAEVLGALVVSDTLFSGSAAVLLSDDVLPKAEGPPEANPPKPPVVLVEDVLVVGVPDTTPNADGADAKAPNPPLLLIGAADTAGATGLWKPDCPNAGCPNAGCPNAGCPNAGCPNADFGASLPAGFAKLVCPKADLGGSAGLLPSAVAKADVDGTELALANGEFSPNVPPPKAPNPVAGRIVEPEESELVEGCGEGLLTGWSGGKGSGAGEPNIPPPGVD